MLGFQHVFDASSEWSLPVEAARPNSAKTSAMLLSSRVLGSIPPIIIETSLIRGLARGLRGSLQKISILAPTAT
ncbi:hypothetical protein [Burkholderia cepacia]|uniref:hypothetical protein n=1 Tax=Burkholderia cepacia TaxID=292 RepID=UPI00398F166E